MTWEHRSIHTRAQVNEAGPMQDGLHRQFWAQAVTFNVVDGHNTKFRMGTFTDSLQTRLPRFMYGHAGWENPTALLGRTLDFREQPDRLELLVELDDFEYVPMARQIAYQLANGTLEEFSIGFQRKAEEHDTSDGSTWITKGRLGELSVVVMGDVPGTKILSFRSTGGAPVIGLKIDTNDVVRLISRVALGEMDMADALSEVKVLAARAIDDQDATDESSLADDNEGESATDTATTTDDLSESIEEDSSTEAPDATVIDDAEADALLVELDAALNDVI